MHFSKGFVATIILGALPAEIAAVPALAPIPAATNASFVDLSLEPRRDRLAVVNTYDSYDCKGETTQFTAAGRHANVCHAGVGNSIQVYAHHCWTSVYSDGLCNGPNRPKYIRDSRCYIVPFASVQVNCGFDGSTLGSEMAE